MLMVKFHNKCNNSSVESIFMDLLFNWISDSTTLKYTIKKWIKNGMSASETFFIRFIVFDLRGSERIEKKLQSVFYWCVWYLVKKVRTWFNKNITCTVTAIRWSKFHIPSYSSSMTIVLIITYRAVITIIRVKSLSRTVLEFT